MTFNVYFHLNDPCAVFPIKKHHNDAGYDLSAVRDYTIQPNQRVLVRTGVSLTMTKGYLGMVCSRSGLAWDQGLFVLNAPGIIDSGFTGDIKVIMMNLGDTSVHIFEGERIAQIVFVADASYRNPEEECLPRGEKGLGSTGLGK